MLNGKSKINQKITREWNLTYTAFSFLVRENDLAIIGAFLANVTFSFTVIFMIKTLCNYLNGNKWIDRHVYIMDKMLLK